MIGRMADPPLFVDPGWGGYPAKQSAFLEIVECLSDVAPNARYTSPITPCRGLLVTPMFTFRPLSICYHFHLGNHCCCSQQPRATIIVAVQLPHLQPSVISSH
jgi:hypothetical protein